MTIQSDLTPAWRALRLGLLAGLDTFFHVLTDWNVSPSPHVERFAPGSGATVLLLMGPVEILAGPATLTRGTQTGAYTASVPPTDFTAPQTGHGQKAGGGNHATFR